MKMLANFSGLVSYVMNEWPGEAFHCVSVRESLSESPQDCQISRALEIDYPTRLFRLVVLFEANLLECLHDLTAFVSYCMRLSHERDYQIPARSLVQQDLAMASCDDLVTIRPCNVSEELVYLPLPENLKMRVRFIEQQYGVGVRKHIRDQQ